jgi:hypothetical protein
MLDFGVYTHILGVKEFIATISYQLLSYLVLAAILNFNMAANQNHVFRHISVCEAHRGLILMPIPMFLGSRIPIGTLL